MLTSCQPHTPKCIKIWEREHLTKSKTQTPRVTETIMPNRNRFSGNNCVWINVQTLKTVIRVTPKFFVALLSTSVNAKQSAGEMNYAQICPASSGQLSDYSQICTAHTASCHTVSDMYLQSGHSSDFSNRYFSRWSAVDLFTDMYPPPKKQSDSSQICTLLIGWLSDCNPQALVPKRATSPNCWPPWTKWTASRTLMNSWPSQLVAGIDRPANRVRSTHYETAPS